MDDIILQLREISNTGNVAGLSGIKEDLVLDALEAFSSDPAASVLFAAFLKASLQDIAYGKVAVGVVRGARDPGIFAEMVAILMHEPDLPEELTKDLWGAFVGCTRNRVLHGYARGHALKAALLISQTRPALLRRLQAELLETPQNDDGLYLRLVAKVMGTVLAHIEDKDLEQALIRLARSERENDEAYMEVGFFHLRHALQAETRDLFIGSLKNALEWFQKARSAVEVRVDAELYAACIGMLLEFQNGNRSNDVLSRIQRIEEASFECAAFLDPSDRAPDEGSWIGSAVAMRFHWTLLGVQLGSLDLSLVEPAWLDAAYVIESQLLTIYSAGRTLFRRSSRGMEIALRPKIESVFLNDRTKLYLLERWIEAHRNSEWMQDATELRARVTAAMEANILRNPPQAAGGELTSAAILHESSLPEKQKKEVLQLFDIIRLDDLVSADPIVCEVTERTRVELEKCPDFRKRMPQKLFTQMVYYTTRFIESRANIQRDQIPGTDYLFDRDMSHQPPEKDLQSDYFGFLQATPLARLCDRETINVGSGRADILFQNHGFGIVAELKKDGQNLTLEALVDAHGLQVAAYQTTSVTLGILLVLDLFDRSGGTPHLREQVQVVSKTPSWGKTEYLIVVCRLQGRRLSPSRVLKMSP